MVRSHVVIVPPTGASHFADADTLNRSLLKMRKLIAGTGVSRAIREHERYTPPSQARREKATRARRRVAKAARRQEAREVEREANGHR
jgi:ribosomal protein S21